MKASSLHPSTGQRSRPQPDPRSPYVEEHRSYPCWQPPRRVHQPEARRRHQLSGALPACHLCTAFPSPMLSVHLTLRRSLRPGNAGAVPVGTRLGHVLGGWSRSCSRRDNKCPGHLSVARAFGCLWPLRAAALRCRLGGGECVKDALDLLHYLSVVLRVQLGKLDHGARDG